jgi:hypothetical protein
MLTDQVHGQAVLTGHLGRDVGQVEVDVEGGQVPHQVAVGAVSEIWNLFSGSYPLYSIHFTCSTEWHQ